MLQELQRSRIYQVKGVQPEGDKIMRMHGQTVLFENGRVLLPQEAPWLTDYIRELTSFPNAKHDDQVDSTSQALAWFNPRRKSRGIIDFYEQEVAEMRLRCE